MTFMKRFRGCLWLFFSLLAASASAQEWGTIKGRFVFGGDVPEPVELQIERDADVCGQHGLVDESLVVNKDNRGLRYVAVWLDTKEKLPIHPEYAARPKEIPVLDNKGCRFEPHMLAIRTGQTMHLTNSDPVAHNAAVYVRRSTPFSEIIPQTQPLVKKFTKPETLPTRVDCSIHAWMKAWLIISDHPYVAITDADGNFELKNVPAGEWKFRFWHERPGFLQTVKQNDSAVPIEKGVWTLKVEGSKTLELGELIAAAEQFKVKK